jgi:hypothetical protein
MMNRKFPLPAKDDNVRINPAENTTTGNEKPLISKGTVSRIGLMSSAFVDVD